MPSDLGDRQPLLVDHPARERMQVEKQPTLAAYQQRGEARPAFGRALAAQLTPFAANAPPERPAKA